MTSANEVYDTSIDENFMPQFAYPPWYALATFYLGYLPIQNAAVLWFEINLVMLFLSIWFLTDGWKPLYRLLAFPAAFLFLPIVGTLVIGQYDFPVLLGTSMLIYAIKHKHVVLTALGLALLTFKPHLGGLIFLAGLIYLLNDILRKAKNLSNFRRDPSLALRVTNKYQRCFHARHNRTNHSLCPSNHLRPIRLARRFRLDDL